MTKGIEVFTVIPTRLVFVKHAIWVEIGTKRIAALLITLRKSNPTYGQKSRRTKYTSAIWIGSIHPTAGVITWRATSIGNVLKYLNDINIDFTEFLDACRRYGWEEEYLKIEEK